MTEKQIISFWWNDFHPLARLELAFKYFPTTHYSNIGESEIKYIHSRKK